MSQIELPHWGNWIRGRAAVVGFRNVQGLAASIGCSSAQLSRWMRMSAPPAQMRRGFDSALVSLLRTDRHTLFVGYQQSSPEHAPIFDARRAAEFDPPDALKRKVHAVVELLDPDKLRELHERGRELLKEEMSAPAA
jgi:DNA-directed RNA polymerase subunit L